MNESMLQSPSFVNAFEGIMGRKPTAEDLKKGLSAQQGQTQSGGGSNLVNQIAGAGGTLAGGYLASNGGKLISNLLGSGSGAAAGGANAAASVATPTLVSATQLPGAASSAANAVNAAGNTTGSSMMQLGNVLPVAGAALGAYGLYEGRNAGQVNNSGSDTALNAASMAAAGAGLGSVIPGVGTLVGGALGGLYGLGMSAFGSSKDKYQVERDGIRDLMQQSGILSDDFKFNGSNLDIGMDGDNRLPDGRRIYEHFKGQQEGTAAEGVEQAFQDEYKNQIVAIDPLAEYFSGGLDHGRDFTHGMIFNGLNDDGQITDRELYDIYNQIGGQGQMVSNMDALLEAEKITKDERDAYVNSINDMYQRFIDEENLGLSQEEMDEIINSYQRYV